MKGNKRIIPLTLYLVGIVIILIWCLLSTSLITKWASDTPIKETQLNSYPQKSYIWYSFDSISITDPLTEEITVMGTYLPAEDTFLEEGWAGLILANKSHCYELAFDMKESEAMALAYKNAKLYCSTSLLKIENGLYDVYFYCWENADTFGMKDTYYQLEKTNDGVELYSWAGEKSDHIIKQTSEEIAKGTLEIVSYSSGFIQVQGWAGLDDIDSKQQRVWIEFENRTGEITQYTTKHVLRGDAGKVSGREYKESGYYTAFPAENLPDGTYTVAALIETNGEIHRTVDYTVAFSNEKVVCNKSIDRCEGLKKSDLINYSDSRYIFNSIESGIPWEKPTILCTLSGYAFSTTDGNDDNKEVELVLDGGDTGCFQTKATISARQDVAAAAGLNNINSGFTCSIFADDLPDGEYKLYIYDRENELDAGLMDTFYRVSKTADGISFTLYNGEMLNEEISPNVDGTAFGGIDKVFLSHDRVNVTGWLAVYGQNCDDQQVFVEIRAESGEVIQYTTEQIMRHDAATVFGEEYDMSGYYTSFPVDSLADGIYNMRAIVRNGNTTIASITYSLTKNGVNLTLKKI